MDLLTLILIIVILAFVFGGPRYRPDSGNLFYTLAAFVLIILVLRMLGILVF